MRALCGAAFLIAIAAILGFPQLASAHALPQPGGESPAAGQTLAVAPTFVSIEFGEPPDAQLSRIQVFDTHESEWDRGDTNIAPGDSKQLRVDLRPLPKGVYTVSWRTVSAIDGHTATGTYAFGVGTAVSSATSVASSSSDSLNVASVVARMLFYAGLFMVIGAAFVGAFAFHSVPSVVRRVLPISFGAAAAGIMGVALVQVVNAHTSVAAAFGTSLGHATLLRGIPLLMGMALCFMPMRKSPATHRHLLFGVGFCAALTMYADVAVSHAAAVQPVALQIALQWFHIVAAGVWLGGLPALLLAIRGAERGVKADAVKRFSVGATVCIIVVGFTGTIRAATEIGTWSALFSTTFGVLVVVKVALFILLAILGAINHFRNVERARTALRPLRRIASAEVLIGLTVLTVAAALVNATPPIDSAASTQPSTSSVIVTGADFATTVKVALVASPGTPGFNQFQLHVVDFNSGAPVDGATVTLHFQFIGGVANIGESSLALAGSGNGDYVSTGSNLSIAGQWLITALIERQSQSVDVQLGLHTATISRVSPSPTSHVTVSHFVGSPTLYTITLDNGETAQVYLDPDRPGPTVFHVTFFAADGSELDVPTVSITFTQPGGQSSVLPLTRLSSGHVVSNITVPSGSSRFDIAASTTTSEKIATYISIVPGS